MQLGKAGIWGWLALVADQIKFLQRANKSHFKRETPREKKLTSDHSGSCMPSHIQ